MAEEFPSRTADTLEINAENSRSADSHKIGKTTVWVQTLNSTHRDKADTEAQWTAGIAARRYRKGTDGYNSIVDDFEAMEPAMLTDFLVTAEESSGRLTFKVDDKYPNTPRPERGVDTTDSQWVEEVARYDDSIVKLGETRLAYFNKLSEEHRKKIESWTKPTRVKRAAEIVLDSRYTKAYSDALTFEILLRAVRKDDDHSQRYFRDVSVIEDLDDDIFDALTAKYRELDSVRPREIPT